MYSQIRNSINKYQIRAHTILELLLIMYLYLYTPRFFQPVSTVAYCSVVALCTEQKQVYNSSCEVAVMLPFELLHSQSVEVAAYLLYESNSVVKKVLCFNSFCIELHLCHCCLQSFFIYKNTSIFSMFQRIKAPVMVDN